MSRSPLPVARILTALACAALLCPPPARSDTCVGLSLGALSPATVGTTPNALAVGDFNRDGWLDVALVNSASNNVSIRLGDGAGGFTNGPGSPIATGATNPVDIAVGDLDRDGILDLVVAFGSGPPRAQVLQGLPGGGFSAGATFGLSFAPSRIYLADFTQDGDLDLVVLAETAQRLLLYQGAAGLGFVGPLTSLDFSTPIPGESPSGAAVLDFNRDGRLDVAVVMRNVNLVRVYAGLGPTGLASAPWTSVSTGNGPADVVAGDVNRDGWPDLVTANSGAATVSVLLNSSGASLVASSPVTVGGVPLRVALVDLNHDGVLDLADLDDSGAPRVAAFQGFTTGPPWFDATPAAVSLSPGLQGLAVGRFTADDGRQDLVTALSVANQVVVIENRSGTPCARSSFALAPRSYPAADAPVSTAEADMDSDGRRDLVVATTTDRFIRILRNVDGGFVSASNFSLTIAPRAVATADMNVDGNADVVVAQGDGASGQVQVWLGNGGGGLAPMGVQPAGVNTSALAIGDFNGDGAPDVAAASEGTDQLFVYLGNGLGAIGAGTPIALVPGAAPRALVAIDLDGDTRLDLAVANSGTANVQIFIGNGNGTFVAGPTLPVGIGPQAIAAADLDGDLKPDLVTADFGAARVSVIRRDGGGGFLPTVGYGTGAGTNPTAVALLDLVNGDGKAEIAVTTSSGAGEPLLSVLANDGAGAFTPHSDHPVRNSPQAITPIDTDSDGMLDLAIPCRSADAVVILVNRSPGPPLFSAAPDADVRDMPAGAAAGDFDGDGDLDLAVANRADNSVSLLNGDGVGGLSQYTTHPAPGAEAVVAADFNRDGRLDLAVSAPGAPSVVILFGAGGGVFAPQPPVIDALITAPDDLVALDYDRDGDLDLAVCNKEAAGAIVLLRNDGLGVFTVVTGPAVGDKPTAIVAADFDRDGDLDLAVANDDSNNVMILANSAGVFVLAQTLPLALGDTSPVSLAAADFDANGTIDLAAASLDSDRIHVYRNLGASFLATPGTFDAPFLPQSITAADLNRDGRPDLIATAAGVSVFRGRGGMDFDPPETVVARHTPVAAVVADFNRDGRPDVVAVNQDSDDVSLLMSSACQARRLEVSLVSSACQVAPVTLEATVRAVDEGGNTATCAAGSVSRSIFPVVPLGGASPLPFVSGVASFTGVTNGIGINDPGRYRLQFQTGGMPPANSGQFTVDGGGPTDILGPDSVCPGNSGIYSSSKVFDTYAWTLTPSGPPPFAYTPSVSLGDPLAGPYTLGLVGRTECVSGASRMIYFGGLSSVTILPVSGASSVCVNCIGGSATAKETGGGAVVSRQWGFRSVSPWSITDMPGETGPSYTLKGASFPGPGTYYVVVRTTASCGPTTVSDEWMVTVTPSVPSGEVKHLAASSRGNAGTGQNDLLWVNTNAPLEVMIRWNKAPDGTSSCLPPESLTSPPHNPPATDQTSITSPAPDAKDSFLHSGLVLDTAYCYSVFVRTGTGWSPGRTVKARPFDSTAGPVKWAYATGGTAVAPPTVSGVGVLAMSNDRTVHALTRGSAGGDWPGPWMPTELVGVAHSRSPVVPFVVPLNGAGTVLFVADDSPTGVLHAVNASSGVAVWPDQAQGKPVTGAPGGLFAQYSGIRDLLLVGTRDSGASEFRGLDLADGALLEAYTGAGSPGPIGAINGSPAIDYATNRVYFASRKNGAGHTLFCLEILPGGAPVFSYKWSRDLGDIVGSPVLRGGRVYVGTEAGTIHSLNASTGPLAGDISDDHVYTPAPADGPVKGFLFPDRRNDDLIFATDTKVWSISDDAPAMTLNWEWTVAGLNPSVVLFRPQTSFVYVGSANGKLYELDFTFANISTPPTSKLQVLGGGLGQVGAPSLDIGVAPPLLLVGSEPGVVYGVTVPFP